VPPLPPGTRYLSLAAGVQHALLLRSDGVVVAFGANNHGQCNVPQLPPGTVPVKMAGSLGHSVALLSDGSIVAFGDNSMGQCNVPPLPAGVRYVDVDISNVHTAAVRSDGALLAWGDNSNGQCNVPPGSYQLVGCAYDHTVAWRSDGVFVVVGNGPLGQANAPTVPPGLVCKELACGSAHAVALMSDGSVLGWGNDSFEQTLLPTIPEDLSSGSRARFVDVQSTGPYTSGVLSNGTIRIWGHQYLASMPMPVANEKFVRLAQGWGFVVGLRTDGSLVGWGDNTYGQTSVPALPPGVIYTDVKACWSHVVALRSDGMAVQFGQCRGTILPLPAGVSYVKADCQNGQTLLLRSDGTVACLGMFYPSQSVVPAIAPGLRYVQVACCDVFNAALRSDGTIALWGSVPANPDVTTSQWVALPPLSSGASYVEISGGNNQIMARRSDGWVVVGGWCQYRQDLVPPLDPGTSYVQVDGGDYSVAARVGPTTTYVTFAAGCAGSRPAARLIPMDTPRVGQTLELNLLDLPANSAFVALGWNRIAPLPLASLGMPGCDLQISIDDVAFVSGQAGTATHRVAIPNWPGLIGMHFFHQALVPDPAAGNSFGAVVSNAAEGVVGDR
jgi:alpha-tubulin suppressor-like RCC1 family protein